MKPERNGPDGPNQQLEHLLGVEPLEPENRVTCYDDWRVEPQAGMGDDPEGWVVIGVGKPRSKPFDDERMLGFLNLLESETALPLDPFHAEMQPDGSVAFPPLPRDPSPVLVALRPFLDWAGDLAISEPMQVSGRQGTLSAFSALAYLQHLLALQSAMLLTLALQEDDSGELAAAIVAAVEDVERQEPGLTASLSRQLGSANGAGPAIARLWLASHVQAMHFARVPALPELGDPVFVEPGPPTPLQSLWLAIAHSAGAITAAKPLPTVFRCAYHRCETLFISRKRGVVGSRRFCCVEHGKRFYAARRMKEKGARARLETTNDAGLEG